MFDDIPELYSDRLRKCIAVCISFHSEDRHDAFDLLRVVQRARNDPSTQHLAKAPLITIADGELDSTGESTSQANEREENLQTRKGESAGGGPSWEQSMPKQSQQASIRQPQRSLTNRWAEAKQISYDGSDWGDDYYEPTPVSARGSQQPNWPKQTASAQRYSALSPPQGITLSNQSFTNPSPTRSDGTYGPGDAGRWSESSGQPSLSEPQGRSESPHRATNAPLSARSQPSRDESAKRFPPRKSSLSQDTPILEPNLQSGSNSATGAVPASDSTSDRKPLPIIRPTDIYKLMEEEREKEREKERRSLPASDSTSDRKPFPFIRPADIYRLIEEEQEKEQEKERRSLPASDSTSDRKPLPIIRPTDIYKLMEEEREKERRSLPASDSTSDRKPFPFIRPADIYRLIGEEQEKE
jgi:hypothetical protein